MVYIYKVIREYDPLCGQQETHSLVTKVSSYDEAYDRIENLILSLKKYRWSILEAFREVGVRSIRFYVSEKPVDIER